MKKGFISIIVPVYNSEKYLKKCIESIMNQTYKKIEIIIVNDGSTDNSINIIEELKKIDSRIVLINQTNAGVSSARNTGLDYAKGEYVTFVDSDDFIDEKLYEKMIENFEENVDIVCCGLRILSSDGKVIEENNYPKQIFSNEEAMSECLKNECIKFDVYTKIFKTTLFNLNKKIRFPIDKLMEEANTLPYIFLKCNKIKFCGVIGYNYCKREGSYTTKFLDYDVKNIYETIDFLEKNIVNLFKNFDKKLLNKWKYIQCINLYRQAKKDKKFIEKNVYEIIYSNFNKIFIKSIFSMTLPIKYKLLAVDTLMNFIFSRRKNINNSNIGIITIYDMNNIGNRLQNYATYYILSHYGKTINIKNNLYRKVTIMHKMKKIIKKLLHSKDSQKATNFAKFEKNICDTKAYLDENTKIDKEISSIKTFIVGSDQVWNPKFGRLSEADLLTFVNNGQKISFSASFGISELPEDKKEFTRRNLEKFKAISVREDAGKDIVEDLTGRKDIEILVDPTMLLSANEWDRVSKKPKKLKKEQKYILNYFLGEYLPEWKNQIEKIAKENNCEIINLLSKDDSFYISGPSEYLYLEKNAFLVCTDSFHSSVFSIIFDTPFIVFDRSQKGIEPMNSRIDTLLKRFNLENRRFNGKIHNDILYCDYSKAKKILEKEKQKSFNFLKRALDEK